MTQFEQDVDGTLDEIQRLLAPADPDRSAAQRIDDLYLVVRLAESLLAVGDEELCIRMHRCCSWAKQDLFEITDDERQLDDAISYLQVVTHTAPAPDIAAELADMLRTRAARTDSIEDLDAAARLLRDALAAPHPAEDAVPLKAFLGLVLAHRFDLTDDLADLTNAIRLLTDAEPEIPSTDPGRPEILGTLGSLHLQGHLAPQARGVATGADLDHGIDLLRDAASYGRYVTARLATALHQRFERDERPADRDEAIAILESLCTELKDDIDPSFLLDLGDLYVEKLREEPTGENYERAIACLRRAWRMDRDEPGLLATLLVGAFGALREIPAADLAWLRELCTELVHTTDPTQQDPMWPGLLGLAVAEQAAQTGDPELCREAIASLTVAAHTDTKLEGSLPIYGSLATMIVHEHTGHWPHERWSAFRLLTTSNEEDSRLLQWLEGQWDAVPTTAPHRPLFAATAALFGVLTGTWAEDASIAGLRQALDLATADTDIEAQVRFALGRVHALAARRSTRPADFEAAYEMLITALPRLSAPLDRAMCTSMLGILTHVAYSSGHGGRLPLGRADDILTAALRDTGIAPESRAMLLVALGQIRSFRWVVDQRDGDMRSGTDLHEQALRILPDDADLRVDTRFSLALILVTRYTVTRNLDDVAAARDHLTAILPQTAERGDDDWISGPGVQEVLEMTTLLRVNESSVLTAEEVREVEATVARLSAKQDRDPTETRWLAIAAAVIARQRGDARTTRELIDIVAGMPAMPDGSPFQKTLDSLGDMMRAGQHLLNHDMQGFHDQLAGITVRMREPDIVPEERTRLLFMLGAMLRVAHTEHGDTAALDTAISHVRQVYAEMIDGVEPFAMYAAEMLSDMYWVRGGQGDSGRAVEAGFDALYHHGRQVLLHAEIEHGAAKAGAIADQAHVLAHRCVATGRLEHAVAAVESGRGLVMSVASSGADVAATLRELGHETTASEWEHSLRTRPAGAAPTDLRSRVLALLTGTSAERRILAPPALAEIAAALRATGADALVYLVPGNADHRGRAVVVSAGARVTAIPLPLLDATDGGVVARYLAVYAQSAADVEWVASLDELVDWAWRAMAGPVLDEIATWRLPATPHVVLVPCGSLGVVPWHAARNVAGDTPRYALQRAVFSYAASARQLCDVAARPVREPSADSVVVADPTGRLSAAQLEARYLYRHCYPDGLYLGLLPDDVPADGVGTADEVLGELPGARARGASMLHLACHAAGGATSAESYVELFRTEQLTVKDLLEHAGGRSAAAPGGLVVLAACRSDLADRDHDEALTLATAFLACGSASVVGTRWEVDDRTSAVLMCLFHRYLTVDRMPPAHALRAAQLWTLDPARVLPPDIAATTGVGDRLEIPLTTWAAYTHQGR